MAVRVGNCYYSNRAGRKEELVRQHESAYAVWFVRSNGDAGVLRVRKSQQVVYPGVRSGVCARVGLRVSTRGLAIRVGRGCLVYRRGSAMVDCCATIRVNYQRWAFRFELT